MSTGRNDPCPCGSGEKYKKCCGARLDESAGRYISAAQEWMDRNILNGRYPDLHGFLLHVDHEIPPEEIWEQLYFWSQQYLAAGENRTKKFHEIVDEAMRYQAELDREDGYNPPFCRKGCANCCYQPVACTDEEAKLIARHCAAHGIEIDAAKLERQTAHMTFDGEGNFEGCPTWDEQPEDDRSCVFLDASDRSCRIWEARPFVCRGYDVGMTVG